MEKQLFNSLYNTIKEDEQYFDEGIINYILNKLGSDKINEHQFSSNILENYAIKTNTVGFYNLAQLHVKPYPNDYSDKCKDKIKKWEEIIKVFDSSLLEIPSYTLTKIEGMGKTKFYTGSINIIHALYNLNDWFKMYEQEPEKYSLTTEEKRILAEDLLEEKQKYTLFPSSQSYNKNLTKFICDVVGGNIEVIKKEHDKSDESIVNKILTSSALKTIIPFSDSGSLENIFKEDTLYAIIKKANLKDNLKQSSNLLSSLLPVAQPEAWIKAFASKENKKQFNILKFLNPLFSVAINNTSSNIEKSYKTKVFWQKIAYSASTHRSRNTLKEIIARLEYLAPSLRNIPLSQEDNEILFTLVGLTEDENLYRTVRNIYNVPTKNPEVASMFYDMLYYKTSVYNNNNKNNTHLSFNQIELQILEEKLQNSLSENNLANNKRLKI